MRILVVGVGARQHAICWRLAQDPGVGHVIVAPGNPLMDDVAEVRADVSLDDLDAVVALARSERVDLVVVGPEDPLVAGLADRLATNGVACFGPSAAAARLEGSKAFARSVCESAGVSMAAGRSFDDHRAALEHVSVLGGRVVVKVDGLAGGKGVVLCTDSAQAEQALREALVERRFGAAGNTVIVEELLTGREASVIAICDGSSFALMPAARDHKRLGDGDTGPNTGGMGAYSPVDELPDDEMERIGREVFAPVLAEMSARGTPFRGALFAGLMLTAEGPRVLEFNVRLGDPEAQAILPRLDIHMSELMLQAATGSLHRTGILPALPHAALALSLIVDGYPESSQKGHPVHGITEARAGGALVFGAGVTRDGTGTLLTAGGRVLTVVGRGRTLTDAADMAYEAAARIEYHGKRYRLDIGRSLQTVAA